MKNFRVTLTVILLASAGALARTYTYRDSTGRRCSQTCPIAQRIVAGICEEQGRRAEIYSCNCDEGKRPTETYVEFACL